MISRPRLVSEVILAASRSSGLAPFGAPEIWANTLAIVPPFSQASPACTFSMASRIVSLTGGEMHNPKTNDERWADEVPLGLRGGEHISLEVTERGASVEYDCAHGTIDEKIVLDRRGRFNVPGTHVEEHGGPVRKDERLNHYPVRFSGRISGKKMQL